MSRVESYNSNALSLDSNTEDSHQRDCKGRHGRFVGPVFDKDDQLIYRDAWTGCKAWGCVTCGKGKLKKLRKRIFAGRISKEAVEAGPFGTKLLTLTLPGAEWRSKTTPQEAKKILAEKWDNLQRNLQKTFGPFRFFKVTEKQRDGFPHYHVLMAGKAIAPKSILEKIRELWSYKYFDAFANVDLKKVKSYVHAVRYITKYLLKGIGTSTGVWWSASRGALEPVWKPEKTGFPSFFSLSSDSTQKEVLVDTEEKIDFLERLAQRKWPKKVDRNFEEVDLFFFTQGIVARFNERMQGRS